MASTLQAAVGAHGPAQAAPASYHFLVGVGLLLCLLTLLACTMSCCDWLRRRCAWWAIRCGCLVAPWSWGRRRLRWTTCGPLIVANYGQLETAAGQHWAGEELFAADAVVSSSEDEGMSKEDA
jgi:hypothetical protein